MRGLRQTTGILSNNGQIRSTKRTGLGYAWYVVVVLLIAQAFSFLDRMIMGLLVGPIRESFQISDTQYSLLAGLAFSLFYAVTPIMYTDSARASMLLGK